MKNEVAIIRTTFPKSMGHLRAGNYHANSPTALKSNLQDFMSVPVIESLMKIQSKMKSLHVSSGQQIK